MITKEHKVKKYCLFYASDFHLEMILLPYIKKNIYKDKFLSVTPGLTGNWAANGRSCTSYDERIKLELDYIDNISLKMDMQVFFKTIITVLKREGAV